MSLPPLRNILMAGSVIIIGLTLLAFIRMAADRGRLPIVDAALANQPSDVPNLHSPLPTPTPTPIPTPTSIPSPTPISLFSLPTAPAALPRPPFGYFWLHVRPSAADDFRLQNGQLIWRLHDALKVLDPQSGMLRWRYKAGESEYVQRFSVSDDAVYLVIHRTSSDGQNNNRLLALNINDGKIRWQRIMTATANPPFHDVLAVSSSLLVFDEANRRISALDPANGHVQWQRDRCTPPWRVVDGTLFMVCEKQTLSQVDLTSGDLIAERPLPDPVDYHQRRSAVRVTNDRLWLRKDLIDQQPPYKHLATQWTLWSWPAHDLLWQHEFEGLAEIILIADESFVVQAGDVLRRHRASDGALIWQKPLGDVTIKRAVLVDPALLISSGAGNLYALDWKTGFLFWTQDLTGSLHPESEKLNVLGIEGDVLVATSSIGQIDAVFGLKTGGQEVWPVPMATRFPTPTPAPLSQTPRPCNEQIQPGDGTNLIDAAVIWLNCHPDDFDGLAVKLQEWLELSPPPDCPSPLRRIEKLDLDGDGQQEYLLAFRTTRTMCQADYGTTWLILEPSPVGYDYFVMSNIFITEGTDLILEDFDDDGDLDVAIQADWCGSTCGRSIIVGHWDGENWHQSGFIQAQPGTETIIEDLDGDGAMEFIVQHSTASKWSFGRLHTKVYGWENGQLTLQEDIPQPDDHPYFLILDANRALRESRFDDALSLAMQALLKANEPGCIMDACYDATYASRMATYAAIEAMLVHAIRRETGTIDALLHEIETHYNQPDNFYLEAARSFSHVFQATQNPLAACQAVERIVRLQGGPGLMPELSWSLPGETLDLWQMCPLDHRGGSLSP